VQTYLQRVTSDIVPWVTSNYSASADSSDMAFGGSSFGGIAALVEAMKGAEGCAFGAVLIESPSMWIGEESFLQVREICRGGGDEPGASRSVWCFSCSPIQPLHCSWPRQKTHTYVFGVLWKFLALGSTCGSTCSGALTLSRLGVCFCYDNMLAT
jgi:hypothetical protein